MCNEFYCNSAFTAFIVFNCREIGLVAVVLRHHNLLSPASPPFYLFLRILFHYSPLLFFHHYSSFRLLPSPPLLDGKGVPQKPPHHVDAHPRAAHVGSAVAHLSRKFVRSRKNSRCFTDLEKMGLHVVEAGVEDHLKIRRVWHFWYKLILVHHLQAFV